MENSNHLSRCIPINTGGFPASHVSFFFFFFFFLGGGGGGGEIFRF